MARIKTHPGEMLKDELAARRLSASRLALDLGVPSGRIVDILNGKKPVTADTALRLARYFGNSAQFWMNLQTQHDLSVAEQDHGAEIAARVARAAQ
jgi:antitoxin HigA-1